MSKNVWNGRANTIWRKTCNGCGYPFVTRTKADELCEKCIKKLTKNKTQEGMTERRAVYNGDFALIEAHRREMRHRWLGDMLTEGIRAKTSFFWLNLS